MSKDNFKFIMVKIKWERKELESKIGKILIKSKVVVINFPQKKDSPILKHKWC
jgi:hypothetical protein